MLKDSFGAYETTFYYKEPANGKSYEFRKYVNSGKIKALGGMWAIYCEDDNCIVFRKSEYLRDKSYKKFSDGCCTDAFDCEPFENVARILSNEYTKEPKYYNLPGKIDSSKLTGEEFKKLRRLIKKGLVAK